MSDAERPSRAYWICQAAGWGLYLAVTVVQAGAMGLSFPRRLVEPLTAALLGIALTHAVRGVARRRGWLMLGTRALVPRIVFGSLAIAAVFVAALGVLEVGVYGDPTSTMLVELPYAVMRWSMVFFIWLAMYFGYGLLEQRRALEIRRLVAENQLQAAELRSLRAQINPHFLFNSLNSIRALVADDPARAQQAITQMAKILRYALGSGKEQTVAFGHELALVGDYLALERLRLQERLTVERNIGAGSEDVAIPVLLLQVLVENAIKHGIAQLPQGGTLRIAAHCTESALEIEVDNPRPREATAFEGGTPGIGLANVSERLRVLFGPEATVAVDLSHAERASARARVPLRTAAS